MILGTDDFFFLNIDKIELLIEIISRVIFYIKEIQIKYFNNENIYKFYNLFLNTFTYKIIKVFCDSI